MAQVSRRRRAAAKASHSVGGTLVRIAKVAELTGVPQSTLRAWERRYGIPKPHRSESGYRLYRSEEVACVIAMRELCEQGTPASEAARLVREREKVADATPKSVANLDPFHGSRAAILAAVTQFDDARIELELRRLLLLGHPVEILDKVLVPVLHTIGEQWQAGLLTIAHEHLASQRIVTLLRDLVALTTNPASSAKVVLACFADDEHELGLLGIALKFANWGMRPILLGARTPPEALSAAVSSVKPSLVALSLTFAPDPKRVRAQLRGYSKACGTVPWLVGGLSASLIAPLVTTFGGRVEPKEASLRAFVRANCEAWTAP